MNKIKKIVEICENEYGITMRVTVHNCNDPDTFITTSFVDSKGGDYCEQNLTLQEAKILGNILSNITKEIENED